MKLYKDITVGEVLAASVLKMRMIGVMEPEQNAEIMLEKILGLKRTELLLDRSRPIMRHQRRMMNRFMARRLTGEPVQYIVGETEFFGLPFKTDRRALIPRPETETLVESTLALAADMTRPEALDIGVGSGAIAVALAANSDCRVTAVDCSSEALELAVENSRLNGVEERIDFIALDIGDEDSTSRIGRKFDLVVSNPPYISREEMSNLEPQIRDYEPKAALTDDSDGLEFYRLMAEILPKLCAEGGWALFEVAANRSEDVFDIFRGRLKKISLNDDLAGRPRVLKGQCSFK